MFTVIPAALAVLGTITVFFYPLGEKEVEMIARELAARKRGRV